jgi:hypothetical protein
LKMVENLTDDQIKKIVSQKFGEKKTPQGDPAKFDSDSAVIHKITRAMSNINGKDYYCYEIDLADQNKNHRIQVDCYDHADVDYERSMATLDLIEKNPQLKSIYSAFSHVLADKATAAEKSGQVPTGAPPSLRFEGKLPVKK